MRGTVGTMTTQKSNLMDHARRRYPRTLAYLVVVCSLTLFLVAAETLHWGA